jgi:hypothetical protein
VTSQNRGSSHLRPCCADCCLRYFYNENHPLSMDTPFRVFQTSACCTWTAYAEGSLTSTSHHRRSLFTWLHTLLSRHKGHTGSLTGRPARLSLFYCKKTRTSLWLAGQCSISMLVAIMLTPNSGSGTLCCMRIVSPQFVARRAIAPVSHYRVCPAL